MDDSDVSEEDEQEQVQWWEELNQYHNGACIDGAEKLNG